MSETYPPFERLVIDTIGPLTPNNFYRIVSFFIVKNVTGMSFEKVFIKNFKDRLNP